MEIIFDSVTLNLSGKNIFSSLNIKLTPHKIIQITGANGSGKSTFLKLAAKLIRPTSGKVIALFDSKELKGEEYRKKIAMLTPEMQLYENLTAEENFTFFTGLRNKKYTPSETLALWERVGLKAPEVKDKSAGKLSTGTAQRLKFAIFLASGAEILLLDEPSANLDEAGREMIIKEAGLAAENGALVLWATNDERERSAADEIIDLSGDAFSVS